MSHCHGPESCELLLFRLFFQRDHTHSSYINRDVDILSPTDLLSFARQIAVGMVSRDHLGLSPLLNHKFPGIFL